MSTEKEISNWYDIFLLAGGIVALINFVKAFRKQPKEVSDEFEKIIAQKDAIIEEQMRQIKRYQKILGYDEQHNNVE